MTPRAAPTAIGATCIDPLPSRIDPPLSVNQEGRFLAEALSLAFGGPRGRDGFRTSRCVRLTGGPDVSGFQLATEALVARHEVLRTEFTFVTPQAAALMAPAILAGSIGLFGRHPFRQTIRRREGTPLTIADVEALSRPQRTAAAAAIASELIDRPFEYGRRP